MDVMDWEIWAECEGRWTKRTANGCQLIEKKKKRSAKQQASIINTQTAFKLQLKEGQLMRNVNYFKQAVMRLTPMRQWWLPLLFSLVFLVTAMNTPQWLYNITLKLLLNASQQPSLLSFLPSFSLHLALMRGKCLAIPQWVYSAFFFNSIFVLQWWL